MMRQAAVLGLLALAVGAVLGAGTAGGGGGRAGTDRADVADGAVALQAPADARAEGAAIYNHDCATCHGPAGAGSYQGPAIDRAGQASVDFYVGTGRMPPPEASLAAQQQPIHYDDAQRQAILAYTATFVQGLAIPQPATDADLARGGQLYRANCGACHHAIGSGGVLAYGAEVPPLDQVDPTRTVEAMRIGPGRMPVFGPDVLSDADASAIAAYVAYLQVPRDRGGWALGHLGPVPEGLLAVLVGLGSLVVITRWLGTRTAEEAEEVEEAEAGVAASELAALAGDPG